MLFILPTTQAFAISRLKNFARLSHDPIREPLVKDQALTLAFAFVRRKIEKALSSSSMDALFKYEYSKTLFAIFVNML